MARVRLRRYEAEDGEVPAICMCCGVPAEVSKNKTFAWHPSWVWVLILVGLLPFVIIAMVLTKRMRVLAPLCQAHKSHWSWRLWFMYGGFAVLALLGIVSWIFLVALDRHAYQNIAGFSCLGVALGGLIWLIAASFVQSSAIHAVEITDRHITLVKVHRAFADALDDYREERREETEQAAPRRLRRSEGPDDDDEEWDRRIR